MGGRGRLGEAENGACQRKNKESRGRGARAVERDGLRKLAMVCQRDIGSDAAAVCV